MTTSTIQIREPMNEKKQRFHIGVVVRTHPRFASLTPREHEVLQWVVQGKSNGDIAVILGLALRTVKKHLERAMPPSFRRRES